MSLPFYDPRDCSDFLQELPEDPVELLSLYGIDKKYLLQSKHQHIFSDSYGISNQYNDNSLYDHQQESSEQSFGADPVEGVSQAFYDYYNEGSINLGHGGLQEQAGCAGYSSYYDEGSLMMRNGSVETQAPGGGYSSYPDDRRTPFPPRSPDFGYGEYQIPQDDNSLYHSQPNGHYQCNDLADSNNHSSAYTSNILPDFDQLNIGNNFNDEYDTNCASPSSLEYQHGSNPPASTPNSKPFKRRKRVSHSTLTKAEIRIMIRLQNNDACVRYRRKKSQTKMSLAQEEQFLTQKNNELKEILTKLMNEKQKLLRALKHILELKKQENLI